MQKKSVFILKYFRNTNPTKKQGSPQCHSDTAVWGFLCLVPPDRVTGSNFSLENLAPLLLLLLLLLNFYWSIVALGFPVAGFPDSSVGKESACNIGDLHWIGFLGQEDPLEKG